MAEVLQLFVNRIGTPIGKMLVVSERDGNLRAVDWTDYEARMRRFFVSITAITDSNLTLSITRMIWRMRSIAALRESSRPLMLYRLQPAARLFSLKCGVRCAGFPVARPSPTRNLLSASAARPQFVQLGLPMAQIRLGS